MRAAVLAVLLGAAPAAASDPQPYRHGDGAPRVLGSPGPSATGAADRAADAPGELSPAAGAQPVAEPGDEMGRFPQLPPKSAAKEVRNSSLLGPASSMVTSLALVLGVFGLVVWGVRRTGAKGGGGLPTDAFQVLGRGNLAPRHQAALVRCGDRVLLVGISASGARTLAEYTDADQVARLCGACTSVPARESFHDALRALGTRGQRGDGLGDAGGTPASLFSRGA